MCRRTVSLEGFLSEIRIKNRKCPGGLFITKLCRAVPHLYFKISRLSVLRNEICESANTESYFYEEDYQTVLVTCPLLISTIKASWNCHTKKYAKRNLTCELLSLWQRDCPFGLFSWPVLCQKLDYCSPPASPLPRPDPSDFLLFKKLKLVLKRHSFDTINGIKTN